VNAADFAAANRVTDAELGQYLEAVNPGRNVVSIMEYQVDVMRRVLGTDEVNGDVLPWKKTHQNFQFAPGETTIWFGINGHGKSAVTGQVALWLALQGKPSCIASFEMDPRRTLERMVLQAAGNPSPSVEFMNAFFFGLRKGLWIYDKRGKIDIHYLLAAVRFCAEKHGIRHFWIDSLMKCVRASDDRNAEKAFVSDVMDVGRETGVHMHVIHHSRKLQDEGQVPDKFDAKGAGEITDQVDNVFCVWRNKAKERDTAKAVELGQDLKNEMPDFLLICDKNRNGGWEGRWALWGDLRTWHFRETSHPGMYRGYELPPYELTQMEPGAMG
jgi:twinkle protein